MGYERSARVVVGELEAGLVAWGGENQKGWTYTSITGAGCAWIDDWDRAQGAADECRQYEPRRVDIAHDSWDGSTGFDATLAAYRAGGFNLCGRPPKCEPMKPERPEDSAIIKVGSRSGNKYLRGYEKGKQLLGPAITAAMQDDPGGFEWGDWLLKSMPVVQGGELRTVNAWDWWRLELELKPQDGPLPEDVIDRRDQYFAGAYPYLGQVLQGVESEALVIRRPRGPQLDLALALEAVRTQYGATLYTALVAHQGDIGAVWSRIVGRKHNRRLVEAGVLMVDHE
jgi:phage replication initiation protein